MTLIEDLKALRDSVEAGYLATVVDRRKALGTEWHRMTGQADSASMILEEIESLIARHTPKAPETDPRQVDLLEVIGEKSTR